MDEELKNQFERLRVDIRTALEETETRLHTALEETETRLRGEFRVGIHEAETKLLRAFFSYQEHADVRFRKLTADMSNVNASSELRLNNLEQRVIELEKRFLMGPQSGPPS